MFQGLNAHKLRKKSSNKLQNQINRVAINDPREEVKEGRVGNYQSLLPHQAVPQQIQEEVEAEQIDSQRRASKKLVKLISNDLESCELGKGTARIDNEIVYKVTQRTNIGDEVARRPTLKELMKTKML